MTTSDQTSTVRTGLFTRKATGLVREAGWFDVIVYNINFVSIGMMALFLFLLVPAFYPGANMALTTIAALLVVLPTSLIFAMFSAAMPRSGGDYVYVSRILGPAWGMMSSWNNTVWWFLYGGVPSAFFARYGLGPMCRTIGIMTGSTAWMNAADWFLSSTGQFVMGALLIIGLVAVFSLGLSSYFRIQNVLFLVATLGLVLTVVALIGKSQADAVHAINHYLGPLSHRPNPAHFVLSAGAKDGYAAAPFSLKWTLIPITWLYLELVFNQSSAYIGGEVKNARSLQIWSMPAAAVYAIAWTLILVGLFSVSYGTQFLGSFGALTSTDLAKVGLTSTPTYTELASWISGSVLIGILLGVGFIFWSYTWLPGQITNASRNLLAYSIDGVMPQWVGRVNDRLHTPIYSMVIVGTLSIAALAIYVFTTYFATLVGIFGFILSFILVSISAIVFPYRKKDMFEASPVAWRWGGVPVITIVGVLSLAACIFMEWDYLNDPLSGLGFSGQGLVMLIVNIAIFLSGMVIYYVASAIQRQRGVNVNAAFSEIPVD